MEELSALAVLYIQKIISEEKYLAKIEKYFNEDPNNKILLELVWMDTNESSLYLVNNILPNLENYDLFGKFLMGYIEEFYNDCEFDEFYNLILNLNNALPDNFAWEEPFGVFSWQDYPVYSTEESCRKAFESAFNYYKIN